MPSDFLKNENQYRRQFLEEEARFFQLPAEEFLLDDLLDATNLPSEQELVKRLEDTGVLEGRSVAPQYLAHRLVIGWQRWQPTSRLNDFQNRLQNCSPGQSDFAKYERIAMDILDYVFSPHLTFLRHQSETRDRVFIRDAIYRNNQSKQFWHIVAQRFCADYIIVDFKNYQDALTPTEAYVPTKYTGSVLGNFVLVVSRRGANDRVPPLQEQLIKQKMPVVLLVISDDDLVKMIQYKETGQDAEAILQSQFDELHMRS